VPTPCRFDVTPRWEVDCEALLSQSPGEPLQCRFVSVAYLITPTSTSTRLLNFWDFVAHPITSRLS